MTKGGCAMADKFYDSYHQEINLTEEQKACLKYTGERTLMVKGYAGSGKSLVLMLIAKKLIEHYGHDQKNMVGIFTYQNTLVSTTREFLEVNNCDEDGIVVSTVNSYIKKIYDDLVMRKKAPKRIYPNTNKKDKDTPKRLKNVESAIYKHRAKYGKHRFHDLPYEFWLDEFDWMKDMNIGLYDLDAYILYKRKGRGNKYRFSSEDYKTAFQIYLMYRDHMTNTGQGDWADQPMYLIRNPQLIDEKYKFKHILIDEAQDLSLAQMLALMLLYKKDMTVAMDANQKIHSKYWTTKLLGIEATTKKLTKSMRTTIQIDELAEAVRSVNDSILDEEDKSIRAIPEETGPLPKLVHLEDQASERKYVVNLVKTYLKANSKMTIGIIAAKNSQIDIYSDWLSTEKINHEIIKKDSTFSMTKPGVKIASAYGAKGLEFNAVIIPLFIEGNFPYKHFPDDEEEYEQYMIKMRNLVYVSMTRARKILIITWSGSNGSRFIADMKSDLYEFEGSPFRVKSDKKTVFEIDNDNTLGTEDTSNTNAESNNAQDSENVNMVTFLKSKGINYVDKRPKDGALWIIGGKELDSIIKETRKLYGAIWTFCSGGGRSTGYKPSWFTKCKK